MFSGTKTYEPDKKKGKIEKRLTGEIEEIEARIGGRIKKKTKMSTCWTWRMMEGELRNCWQREEKRNGKKEQRYEGRERWKPRSGATHWKSKPGTRVFWRCVGIANV